MAPVDNDSDSDDSCPTSDEDVDVEAAKKVLPTNAAKTKVENDAKQPLLSNDQGAKQPVSDEVEIEKPLLSPRDKFRQKSATTPRGSKPSTPRESSAAASADVSKDATVDAHHPAAAAAAGVETLKSLEPTSRQENVQAASTSKVEVTKAMEAGKALLAEMIADAPPPITSRPEAKRVEAFLDGLAADAEGKAPSGMTSALKPCLMVTIQGCLAVQPWVDYLIKWGTLLYNLLPVNVAQMMFGAALCYFGGAYPATIAAVEAFRTMGFERARQELAHITEQAAKVAEASATDDAVDEDGDGVADVEQIQPSELVRRKLFLIMCEAL